MLRDVKGIRGRPGEQALECPVCNVKFVRRRTKMRHMKAVHLILTEILFCYQFCNNFTKEKNLMWVTEPDLSCCFGSLIHRILFISLDRVIIFLNLSEIVYCNVIISIWLNRAYMFPGGWLSIDVIVTLLCCMETHPDQTAGSQLLQTGLMIPGWFIERRQKICRMYYETRH